MTTYDLEYIALNRESTWGTSLLTGAGDTGYKYGVMLGGGQLPWARRMLSYDPIPLNQRHTTTIRHGKYVPLSRQPTLVALTDGVPLYFSFGACTTTGASAPYTHALSFPVGSSAAPAQTPSATWHRERVDSAGNLDDDVRHILGSRVTSTVIKCYDPEWRPNEDYLACVQTWVGKTEGDAGFSLSTKPDFRISGTSVFNWSEITTNTWAGTGITGMMGFELSWQLPIIPEWDFRTSGGSDVSYQVNRHHYGRITPRLINLYVRPDAASGSVLDQWFNEPYGTTGTPDLSIVFTRGTNDTITFTGTNMWVMDAVEDVMQPGETEVTRITASIETLSCSVVDSLASTHYEG